MIISQFDITFGNNYLLIFQEKVMKKQEYQGPINHKFPSIISQTKQKFTKEDHSLKNKEMLRNASKSQNDIENESQQALNQQTSLKIEWTQGQESMLIQKHQQLGNKWASISQFLNGKNDNCVKNHFYSRLRKMIRRLNRIIQIYFKKSLKTIPNATIYKFVEASEQRFKQKPNCSIEVSMSSQDVITRMLKISVKEQMKSEQVLEIQRDKLDDYKELIQQISRTNKNYKKKSKKIKNSTIKAPLRTKKTNKHKIYPLQHDEEYRADQSSIQSEKQSQVGTIKKNTPKFEHELCAYEQEEPVKHKVLQVEKKVQIKQGDQMQQLLKNIGLLHEGKKPEKQHDQKSEFGNQSLRSYSDFQNPSQGLSFMEQSNNGWKKESRMFTRINKRLFGGSGSEVEGL